MSHFYAYLSRMKFIKRWGLMRNIRTENIQEHSLQVAMIAHCLALIRNQKYNGKVNPERVATLALYHDASEVITGDLPTPIKYKDPSIRQSYKKIEHSANQKLLHMLPNWMQKEFATLLLESTSEIENRQLVRAADKLSAYFKCIEEVTSGNKEFHGALRTIKNNIKALEMPEVQYFLETFEASFSLNLDELEA